MLCAEPLDYAHEKGYEDCMPRAGDIQKQPSQCRSFSCQAAESPASGSSADDAYSNASLEELKDRLELTVRAEDYKVAAAIRDEIRSSSSRTLTVRSSEVLEGRHILLIG